MYDLIYFHVEEGEAATSSREREISRVWSEVLRIQHAVLNSSCSGLVAHLDSSLWLIALCPFVLVSV